MNYYLDKNPKNRHYTNISINKLLLCSQEWSDVYDFIILVDADILININSPPLHNYYDYKYYIGVIDEYSQPTKERRISIQRKMGWETSATDYYKLCGFNINTDMVFNGGVYVMQPKIHKEFLEELYNKYIDISLNHIRGFHFEQSCIGYYLQNNNLYKVLDNKFNAVWSLTKLDNINNISLEDFFKQNYFIHFAGHCDHDKVRALHDEYNNHINNTNITIITTTLSHNKISEIRRNNLINNFSKYNIPVIFNHGIKSNNTQHHIIMFNILKNAMGLYNNIKNSYEYALICDDDFCPINDFLKELNKTVNLLPNNWRCLHLCPGYLWGRLYKDMSKVGKLNPEFNIDMLPFHDSGRYFINCNNNIDIYNSKGGWLGAPIAILVNKNNIESLLNDFILEYNKSNHCNDVILTRIINENDYICREPLLGFEKEEGGSTFL